MGEIYHYVPKYYDVYTLIFNPNARYNLEQSGRASGSIIASSHRKFQTGAPAIKHNNEESIFAVDKEEIILKDFNDDHAGYIIAAYALLKRLRILEKDFINALEK